MLGVIGGTGFYCLGRKVEEHDIVTPYGIANASIVSLAGEQIAFISRHDRDHHIPPHRINHRANVAALMKLGVNAVLAFYSAGIISKYKPGDIVLLDDFIGFWSNATFYSDFSAGIRHKDFTEPFCRDFAKLVKSAASATKMKLKDGGVIATTHGPRYETVSEVKALKKMGANLVNMTAAPEIALLGESEIDFAAFAVGANYAAGIGKKPVSTQEINATMKSAYGRLSALAGAVAEEISE